MCDELTYRSHVEDWMRNTVPRTIVALMIPIIMSTLPSQGQQTKDYGWSNLLPPGEGRGLIVNSCANCHNLKIVVVARKSPVDWKKSVDDMIQRGAPVFPEEIKPITDYLSKAFSPEVPKLVNVNTATRADIEKLPISPETVTRILEARSKSGRFKDSEELRHALDMSKVEFNKLIYLFIYSD